MRRVRTVVPAGLLAVALVAAAPAAHGWYPRPGHTERVSVASDGTQSDRRSFSPSISGDGRYVAFHSQAATLAAGITNSAYDVFVHDRVARTTERVSVASDGTEGNDDSWYPSISGDGRYVAFASRADNLVPDDENNAWDVFVHDRVKRITERVSVTSDGDEANHWSEHPAITPDGRYVAFQSRASNLADGVVHGQRDVFVHDRATGVTELVSVTTEGSTLPDESRHPSISADGRHVAFHSRIWNFEPDAPLNWYAAFVHDREAGVTEQVSVSSDGQMADTVSWYPKLSADGRHVVFASGARNLVPVDTTPEGTQVFVRDRVTGRTERVSVPSDGREDPGGGFDAVISADGRHVAFASYAFNLVPDDRNTRPDVFVHDRHTRATERVSISSARIETYADSFAPAISADGRSVAFEGLGSTLVPGDSNNVADVFVRDRGPQVGVGGLRAVNAPEGVVVSGWATWSATVVTAASGPTPGPPAEWLEAQLTGASLSYRPEQGDLAVRLSLDDLSAHTFGLSRPGTVYGMAFALDGVRYEVRGQRMPVSGVGTMPWEASFGLYRCDPVCLEVGAVTGSIGTTGLEVLAAVPLDLLGDVEGAAVTDVAAFAGPGERAAGAVPRVAGLTLPDAAVPARTLRLGLAPAGAAQAAVDFATSLSPSDGRFTVVLAHAEVAGRSVWVQACLGDACQAAQVPTW